MNRTHFVPTSRHSMLARPRLLERALRSEVALALLSGGPGAGKTVAAAQLATELAERGEHVVWTRLTADDGEYRIFWQRLLESLVEAGTAPEQGVIHTLVREGLPGPDIEIPVEALAQCPQPLTVVIDDLHHVLGGDVEDVVESLLHALESIAGLRVIATTRSVIPQLTSIAARMRVPVIELLESDLAFTSPEVELLLGTRIPQLEGSELRHVAENVMRESVGWPIAAHAAIVEHNIADEGRPVTARGSYIRGYVNRMLEDCGSEKRRALLVSGLLPETSPRVLAAMLGENVEWSREQLDNLPGVNIVYWDDEHGERWYRHHDLVREELARRARDELGEERLRACYRGGAVTLIDTHLFEAVRSALRAHAWEILSEVLLLDSYAIMTGPRSRLSPWLKDIPENVRQRFPVLAAFALFDEYAVPGGRPDKVLQDLEMLANRTLTTESTRGGPSEAVAIVLRMIAARFSGNEELAVSLADRAQAAVEEMSEEDARRHKGALALVATQRPITLLHTNRFDEAEHALRWIEATPERFDERSRSHAAALAAFGAALRGDIPWAHELIERCERINPGSRWPDVQTESAYRIAIAIEALDRGDLKVAEENAAALSAAGENNSHWPHILVVETLIRDIRSGPEEALTHLDGQLARRVPHAALATAQQKFAKMRARLAWHVGRAVPRVRGRLHESSASVYWALSWNDHASARAIIGRLLQKPDIAEYPRERAELLLLKAEAARLDGDARAAQEAARHAADLLEEYQLGLPLRALSRDSIERLRTYDRRLRPEFGAVAPGVAMAQLSPAEQRTITAVAVHGSVAAAAQALFLSPQTVKSHVKSVYRKLGVSGRAEALRVAGDAGLINASLLAGAE